MNFDFAREVEARMDSITAELNCPTALKDAIRYSALSNGKRLRATLFLTAFSMFENPTDDAIAFAAAIEFLHAYTLVHDDMECMDNDSMRRGKPSVHAKYGEGVALLTGDALLNLCYETITKLCASQRYARAAAYFASCAGAEQLIGGQYDDTEGGKTALDSLLSVYKRKTAALIRGAAVCGAICAGADEVSIKRIEEASEVFGAAFQIYDDITEFDEGKVSDEVDAVSILGRERAVELLNELQDEAAKIDNAALIGVFQRYRLK